MKQCGLFLSVGGIENFLWDGVKVSSGEFNTKLQEMLLQNAELQKEIERCQEIAKRDGKDYSDLLQSHHTLCAKIAQRDEDLKEKDRLIEHMKNALEGPIKRIAYDVKQGGILGEMLLEEIEKALADKRICDVCKQPVPYIGCPECGNGATGPTL